MQIQRVAATAKIGGDDVRLAVHDKAHMANKRLVENFKDRLAVIVAALGQPLDLRPFARCKCAHHYSFFCSGGSSDPCFFPVRSFATRIFRPVLFRLYRCYASTKPAQRANLDASRHIEVEHGVSPPGVVIPSAARNLLFVSAIQASPSPPAWPRRAPRGTRCTPARACNWSGRRRDNRRFHRSPCLCRRASAPTPRRCRPGRKSAPHHPCPVHENSPLLSAAAPCRSVFSRLRAVSPRLRDSAHNRPNSRACFRLHDFRRGSSLRPHTECDKRLLFAWTTIRRRPWRAQ